MKAFISLLPLFISALWPAAAQEDDWPQLLGPSRNGATSSQGAKLLSSIPDDGLKRVWSVEVGEGFAGPVLAGECCYLFHRESDEAVIDCFGRKDGVRRWRFTYETGYVDNFGFDDGPRSCPTVAGGRLFAYGAEGMLHALDATSGALIWKVDLEKSYRAENGFFGRCSSPLVVDDRVLLDIGGRLDNGEGANLVGFDAATGALAWAADSGQCDYASPSLLALPGGQKLAVFFVREGVRCVRPKDGTIVFQEKFRSSINASVNAASPVVVGRRFFLSACYGVGCGLWEASDSGTSVRPVYKKADRLDAHFATPVHHEGHLYGFHGRQEDGQTLRCIRLSDAEVIWSWKERSVPAGALLLVDDVLLVLSEKGELLMGKASPAGFSLQWRGQVLGAGCRALPAFADGFVFARDGRQLVCVDLRETSN